MRLKIILTGIGLALVALGAIAFTILMATDFNDYGDLVQQRMKAATGRDLVIAGNIDVSLSPSPRLTARQVSFRNAPWSDLPQMASLEGIEAELALLPLLSGEIRITEVVLHGGQVVVETSKEGIGNWVLDLAPQRAGTPETSTTASGGLPRIDRMTIEDVTLLYRDGESGKRQTLTLKRFTAEDAPGAGIKIAIKGAWNERPLELTGMIGAPRQFTEGPLPVDLKGKLSDIAFGLHGEIGDPTTFSDLSLEVTSSGPSLFALGDIFGVTLPQSAAYTLKTRVSGGEGKFTFSDSTAREPRDPALPADREGAERGHPRQLLRAREPGVLQHHRHPRRRRRGAGLLPQEPHPQRARLPGEAVFQSRRYRLQGLEHAARAHRARHLLGPVVPGDGARHGAHGRGASAVSHRHRLRAAALFAPRIARALAAHTAGPRRSQHRAARRLQPRRHRALDAGPGRSLAALLRRFFHRRSHRLVRRGGGRSSRS